MITAAKALDDTPMLPGEGREAVARQKPLTATGFLFRGLAGGRRPRLR